KVETALTRDFRGVVSMSADEARRLGLEMPETSAKVWEVPNDAIPEMGSLYVSVEASFPASVPKLFPRAGKQWFLKILHVNKDGSMCIVPEHATIDQFHCGAAVVELVETAFKVIKDGIGGVNRRDFVDEIECYW